jgi:PPP family 3-phenylpropionic acid transporter
VDPIRRAALTYAVYFTAIGASWAYLPVYYRELGLGLATIGLLAAMSAAIQLVAAPAWGALADHRPRSRLGLPVAALVAAAGAFGLAVADGLPALAASLAVLALGSAGIGPVLDARALELLGTDRHRYGELRAIGSLAFVVVTWTVGLLLDERGTGALFLVFVPALMATALVAVSLPRHGGGRRPGIWRGVGVFARTPGVALFLVGALLTWTLLNATNGFYSIQVVALGGSTQMVGLAWAVGAAVEVPVMGGHRHLAARLGAGRLLVLGAAVFAVRAALAAAATSAGWLVAIAPLEGLGFALFFVGGVGFVSSRAPAGLAATAQGVFSAIVGLASILGAGLGGLVAGSTSIATLFAVTAAGGVLATGVVALASRSSGRMVQAAEPAAPRREPATSVVAALDDLSPYVPEEVHP